MFRKLKDIIWWKCCPKCRKDTLIRKDTPIKYTVYICSGCGYIDVK